MKLKRHNNDVGKYIGGCLYVHRQYEGVIPGLEDIKKNVGGVGGYNLVKYNTETGVVTFICCNGFDTDPEPTLGNSILVKPDGSYHFFIPHEDPWIYHHKWLMVRDDYQGFNVAESKKRSEAWLALEDIDKSRIGKLSYWTSYVLPRLTT